jgi:AcrR family transcriptional regulator
MRGDDRRTQLLDAARREFVERGYRDVTTSDVAALVGVSDALVFKHFGTKEALFRAAVVEPLLGLIEGQVEENRARLRRGVVLSPAEAEAAIIAFLTSWATLVAGERRALLSLLADLRHFPDVEVRLLVVLRDHLDDLASTLLTDTHSREYRTYDPRVATWVSVAAATLAGLLEDEDIDRFVGEFVNVLMRGVVQADKTRPRRGDRHG